MKHFTFGLGIGLAAGFVLSLLRDEDDKRLKDRIKEEATGFKAEASDLSRGLKNAQAAASDLQKELPAATAAMEEVADEVANFKKTTDFPTNKDQIDQ